VNFQNRITLPKFLKRKGEFLDMKTHPQFLEKSAKSQNKFGNVVFFALLCTRKQNRNDYAKIGTFPIY
jgi:hypothetical protein